MCAAAFAMTLACKGPDRATSVDYSRICEYTEAPDSVLIVDSILGYATFSADGIVTVIPEEITENQYQKLLTDKYTVNAVAIDTGTQLFASLDKQTRQNAKRYDILRGLDVEYDELLAERREGCESSVSAFYHYPDTKQYECAIWAPLTTESFMMTEDGIIDSTFMQSQTRTYGTNGIFVGAEGFDCDHHASLWFYWYDKSKQHMVPLCHYVDYRWHEDCFGFNLCWVNDSTLLVATKSTGPTTYGWVGGYKANDIAPFGTPVYYKLSLRITPPATKP